MDNVATKNVMLARAFSPRLLSALASADTSAADTRVAALLAIAGEQSGTSPRTLGNVFDDAHATLARGYRSEYFFKNSIISKVVFGRHSAKTASALLELPAGGSIADVVVLTGTSTAYEVKTDLDSFSRLGIQVRDYSKCFEKVTVVTSFVRMQLAAELTPSFVGVVGMRSNGDLAVGRKTAGGLSRLEHGAMFELLRTTEALALLRHNLDYEIDVPRGDIWQRCKDLFHGLPLEVAHAGIVSQLRLRGFNGRYLAEDPDFPRSLRALSYATELTRIGRDRALKRLTQDISLRGGTTKQVA